MLTEQEVIAAQLYSRGDSSQIIALAIVLARRLDINPVSLIKETNNVLAAVREVRVGR